MSATGNTELPSLQSEYGDAFHYLLEASSRTRRYSSRAGQVAVPVLSFVTGYVRWGITYFKSLATEPPLEQFLALLLFQHTNAAQLSTSKVEAICDKGVPRLVGYEGIDAVYDMEFWSTAAQPTPHLADVCTGFYLRAPKRANISDRSSGLM